MSSSVVPEKKKKKFSPFPTRQSGFFIFYFLRSCFVEPSYFFLFFYQNRPRVIGLAITVVSHKNREQDCSVYEHRTDALLASSHNVGQFFVTLEGSFRFPYLQYVLRVFCRLKSLYITMNKKKIQKVQRIGSRQEYSLDCFFCFFLVVIEFYRSLRLQLKTLKNIFGIFS